MSGKKGGKQYRQERKRKTSEDSTESLQLRRNGKELERVDDKPTSIMESHNSEEDSDELPNIQL